MLPSLTVLNHGEWRLNAWDMVLMTGDRYVARKLLNDKVNRSRGSYVEPEVIAAWKSRFKQLVGELRTDEKSLLYRFYKSSVWFTHVGLLYARWAEET